MEDSKTSLDSDSNSYEKMLLEEEEQLEKEAEIVNREMQDRTNRLFPQKVSELENETQPPEDSERYGRIHTNNTSYKNQKKKSVRHRRDDVEFQNRDEDGKNEHGYLNPQRIRSHGEQEVEQLDHAPRDANQPRLRQEVSLGEWIERSKTGRIRKARYRSNYINGKNRRK
ncbi:unnamed protein product [Agarophyton chilense]